MSSAVYALNSPKDGNCNYPIAPSRVVVPTWPPLAGAGGEKK